MRVCAWGEPMCTMCVHVPVEAEGIRSPELESQAAVSSLMWVLGTEPESSTGTAGAANH